MMKNIRKIYPDGTEKQTNPFTGAVVWYVPGRKNRPILTHSSVPPQPLVLHLPEDYCNFCPAMYFNTTPEKARVVISDGKQVQCDHLPPKDIFSSMADYRKIANLFEISTFHYWTQNYDYQMPPSNQEWMENYISTEIGKDHLVNMVTMKIGAENSKNLSSPKNRARLLELAAPFFGGSHEIIIPQRHYIKNAKYDNQLFFAGEKTPKDHFFYFKFTVNSIDKIYKDNPHVKYVSVFQNWLKDSGASFEHLHRQLLGIDEYGEIISRKIEMEATESGVFNKLALNWAIKNNLVIAENDGAVAFVDVGYPYPTVAVYAKGNNGDPCLCSKDEIQNVSNIVHAIHKAAGRTTPTNEEWHYTPKNNGVKIPWHILIKFRTNIIAGFEGGTNIFVNPLSLEYLRDQMVDRFRDLLTRGEIGDMHIGNECKTPLDVLEYF